MDVMEEIGFYVNLSRPLLMLRLYLEYIRADNVAVVTDWVVV